VTSGHRPRKRFGQHFLHDEDVINRIVAAIAPMPGETLIEIGPGEGALTGPLLDSPATLHVIEKDRDLAQKLPQQFADRKPFHVHCQDALLFDFHSVPGPLRIVGNLPYNISTPLLFHLLDSLDCINDMVFMLQTEVVDRLNATPGKKAYGRLSVMVQSRCEVEKLFSVDPQSFTPPPRVESAVVRLRPLETPLYGIEDFQSFIQIVRQSFNQRRKTLRNSLKGLLSADQIELQGINPGARAEELSIADFAVLANLYHQQLNHPAGAFVYLTNPKNKP